MRTIIAGSRDILDYDLLCNVIESTGYNITCVISGTANGVDKLGEKYAQENNIKLERYPADWNRYGKSAGYKRNKQMEEVCDAAIIVWDGHSKGTKHMIDIMKDSKKPYCVFNLSNNSFSGIAKKLNELYEGEQ